MAARGQPTTAQCLSRPPLRTVSQPAYGFDAIVPPGSEPPRPRRPCRQSVHDLETFDAATIPLDDAAASTGAQSFRRTEFSRECAICAHSDDFLVIGLSSRVRLLAPRRPLAPGHLVICPDGHQPSCVECDERTAEHLRLFKRSVCEYHLTSGAATLFVETALVHSLSPQGVLQSQAGHGLIHAIPIPLSCAGHSALAQMRTALEHVDCSGQLAAPMARAATVAAFGDASLPSLPELVPEGSRYVSLTLGLSRGFVHVPLDGAPLSTEAIWASLLAVGLVPAPGRPASSDELLATKRAYEPFDWILNGSGRSSSSQQRV